MLRGCRRLVAPCLLLSFAGCDRAPENREREVTPEREAVSTGQGARISPQEEEALRAWRPMARALAQSFPEIRILVRHRMSQAEILSLLDSSVAVEETASEMDHLYIPVAPSQGFILEFDSSGKLASVVPLGATQEPWMNAPDVEPSRATDAAAPGEGEGRETE